MRWPDGVMSRGTLGYKFSLNRWIWWKGRVSNDGDGDGKEDGDGGDEAKTSEQE